MYNSPYNNIYNSQVTLDRINSQIVELEKMKQQLQQPPQQQNPTNLTQNFQLAPTSRETMKYANSIDEVQKDIVVGDTPYFSRDMSILWVKNTKGDIKAYELNEIIPKDEKDMQIELLQSQINELRKEMRNNEPIITNDNATEITTNSSEYDETIGESVKKNKPASVQRISTGKKK